MNALHVSPRSLCVMFCLRVRMLTVIAHLAYCAVMLLMALDWHVNLNKDVIYETVHISICTADGMKFRPVHM